MLNGGNVLNELYEQAVFTFTNDPSTVGNVVLFNSTNTTNQEIRIRTFTAGSDIDYDIIVKSGNTTIIEYKNLTGESDNIYNASNFSTFNNLTFYIRARLSFSYQMVVDRFDNFGNYTNVTTSKEVEGTYTVKDKMPDIKIIDYLKGLFQMFKLVVIPTSQTELFVTTLNDYYKSGKVVDVTEFIDFKEVPLSTGKLLSEINYKFKESQTVLGTQFRENNRGVDYGSLELDILDDTGKLTEGGKVDYELPFENHGVRKINRFEHE